VPTQVDPVEVCAPPTSTSDPEGMLAKDFIEFGFRDFFIPLHGSSFSPEGHVR
jgi:hypothetical protein